MQLPGEELSTWKEPFANGLSELSLALPFPAWVTLEPFLRTTAVWGGEEGWALVSLRSRFEF